MKKLFHYFFWCFALLVYLPDVGLAQDYVRDEGSYLSSEEEDILSSKLRNYQQKTSNEVAIRTVYSLKGQVIEEYANELFKELKLGKKGQDNGVLILLAKKERKIRIEVGYGLEAALTDLEASRIIEVLLKPAIRRNQTFQGLEKSCNQIFKLLDEDPTTNIERKPIDLLTDLVSSYSFMLDATDQVFSSREVKRINLDLEKYAQTTGNYIFVMTSEQFYVQVDDVWKAAKATYPQAKNYSLLLLRPYVGGGHCGSCKMNKLSAHLHMKWRATSFDTHHSEELQKRFENAVFNYYFEGLNPYGKTWFYAGLQRSLYLLKAAQDTPLELEDIKPSFWYARGNYFFVSLILPLLSFAFVVILIVIIAIKNQASNRSTKPTRYKPPKNNPLSSSRSSYGSYTNHGHQDNYGGGGGSSYDSGSGYSDSGGSSSDGGSFGGGDSGGGGASDDY